MTINILKSYLIRIAVPCAMLLPVGSYGAGANNMTLSDTLDYIGDLLVENSLARHYEYENCTILIENDKSVSQELWMGVSEEYAAFAVSLDQVIGVTRVTDRGGDMVVRMHTTTLGSLSVGKYYSSSSTTPLVRQLYDDEKSVAAAFINVGDNLSYASRLQKSLQHAVNLCQRIILEEDPFVDEFVNDILERLENTALEALIDLDRIKYAIAIEEYNSISIVKSLSMDEFDRRLSQSVTAQGEQFDRLLADSNVEDAQH